MASGLALAEPGRVLAVRLRSSSCPRPVPRDVVTRHGETAPGEAVPHRQRAVGLACGDLLGEELFLSGIGVVADVQAAELHRAGPAGGRDDVINCLLPGDRHPISGHRRNQVREGRFRLVVREHLAEPWAEFLASGGRRGEHHHAQARLAGLFKSRRSQGEGRRSLVFIPNGPSTGEQCTRVLEGRRHEIDDQLLPQTRVRGPTARAASPAGMDPRQDRPAGNRSGPAGCPCRRASCPRRQRTRRASTCPGQVPERKRSVGMKPLRS